MISVEENNIIAAAGGPTTNVYICSRVTDSSLIPGPGYINNTYSLAYITCTLHLSQESLLQPEPSVFTLSMESSSHFREDMVNEDGG